MRALILGGCGFIGRHTVQALIEQGVPTVVWDVHADPARSTTQCAFERGDFADADRLDAVMAKHAVTHVVHLVSTTLPKNSNEDKQYDVNSNVIQTLRLLDLCVKYKVQRLLFMSSGGTVYGVPETVPVDESHPNQPLCSYGITKLAIEKYLYLYQHLHGLNYVILRAANPYGPWQNPLSGQGVVANFVHKMHAQEPLEVWGDGSAVRDYFHVRDLVSLVTRALFSNSIGTYNAGSGVGVSINQLIGMLSLFLDRPVDVIYLRHRRLDVPAIVLNCQAAERQFQWRAETSMKAGLEDYVKWYLAN